MAKIEIQSEITGTVWKVLVNPGDKVKEDDPMLILESMKMEIPVLAPEAGTVSEVLVKEGEPVSDGSVVVRLER